MHFTQVESIVDQTVVPEVCCLAAPSNPPKILPMAFSYDPLLDPLPPPDTDVDSTCEASAWSTSSAASDDTGFGEFDDETPSLDAPDPAARGLGVSDFAPPALNCAYLPCDLQMSQIVMASSYSADGDPCTLADQGWKAVMIAPLDLRHASTAETCFVCGGGSCGSGCRRSALLSMSPPLDKHHLPPVVPQWSYFNTSPYAPAYPQTSNFNPANFNPATFVPTYSRVPGHRNHCF